jgi:hypothetical protein
VTSADYHATDRRMLGEGDDFVDGIAAGPHVDRLRHTRARERSVTGGEPSVLRLRGSAPRRGLVAAIVLVSSLSLHRCAIERCSRAVVIPHVF